MNSELAQFLHDKGADIVRFVDISELPAEQTQCFSGAILVCMVLSREFIQDARSGNLKADHDEFVEKEHNTDELADWLMLYLRRQGYRAYSQSEDNNTKNGRYDEKTRSSALPHKTIARLAGLGFIGKNNLLVTPAYGCALSMCTVLTDAPISPDRYPIISPMCGTCDVCRNICPTGAIHGNEWSLGCEREFLVDVFKCVCPLACMLNCPWTLRYVAQKT